MPPPSDADVHLIPDRDPKWEKMTASPEMMQRMKEEADLFLPGAVSVAPVRTGRYKESLKVGTDVFVLNGLARAASYIVSDDPKAWKVEWGKGAKHPLGRISKIMRSLR